MKRSKTSETKAIWLMADSWVLASATPHRVSSVGAAMALSPWLQKLENMMEENGLHAQFFTAPQIKTSSGPKRMMSGATSKA